jgi:hypothetical protein
MFNLFACRVFKFGIVNGLNLDLVGSKINDTTIASYMLLLLFVADLTEDSQSLDTEGTLIELVQV